MERKISLRDAGGDLNETIFYRRGFLRSFKFLAHFYDGNLARVLWWFDNSRAKARRMWSGGQEELCDVEIILEN